MAELRELATGLGFPEGPVVLVDGSVLVCEMTAGRVTRVTADGGTETVAEPGGGPNGAQIGPDGKLYVCNNGSAYDMHALAPGVMLPVQPPSRHEGGRIERIDIETGEVERIYEDVDGRPLIAPNDLVFDEHGGFWLTDHAIRYERSQDRTFIMYAQPDGSSIREVMGPVDCPNGIALSPDGTRLYAAETYSAAVLAWTISGPGEIEPVEGLLPHGGLPIGRPTGFAGVDSLAIEAGGNLCLATLAKACITVMSPEGDELELVETGDPITTNIAFGGDDMKTAYVTASATGRLLVTGWPRPGLALAYQA
jgi:gluconolactonase